MPLVVHSQRGFQRACLERQWWNAETSLNHCEAINRSLRQFVPAQSKSTSMALGDKNSFWQLVLIVHCPLYFEMSLLKFNLETLQKGCKTKKCFCFVDLG